MKSLESIIISGASSGMGYQCAKVLAADTSKTIVVASRDLVRSQKAAEEISAATGNSNVIGMKLNLESLKEVRSFCEEFHQKKLPPLKTIVCNAGIQMVSQLAKTADGFEKTFAVNHLGHFLLVNLLIKDLSAPAKIVVVSSGTHDPSQKTGMPVPEFKNVSELAYIGEGSSESDGVRGRRAYTNSKLCNVLFTYELHRRIQGRRLGLGSTEVTVNAFDPGLMPGSGLARDYGILARIAWTWLLPILRLFTRNVNSMEKSGRNLARLVTDESLKSTSGKYFEGTKVVPSSRESYSEERAHLLWEESSKFAGLTQDV